MTSATVQSIPVHQCICGEQNDPTAEVCFAKVHRTAEEIKRIERDLYLREEFEAGLG